MSNSMLLELQQKPSQNIKQLQRLIMSRQMQQAIHFLQIPVMELTPLVDLEIEHNPVLEYSQDQEDGQEVEDDLHQLEEEEQEEAQDEENVPETELDFVDGDFEVMRRLDQDFRDHFSESGDMVVKRTKEDDEYQTFLEASVRAKETIFEHLMQQAHEVFDEKKQLPLAEALIGSLDESGFLTLPLQELALLQGCSVADLEKVLKEIQTFHPVGVGARSLKEALLIQLRTQKKENTLAYQIVEKHFDDLLHNRISAIKKELHCTAEQIGEAVDHDIAKLDLHPGTQVMNQAVPYIIPDVTVRQEDEELIVGINDDSMPRLRLNSRYLRMLDDKSLSQETKDFIKQKVVSAKWLLRNILQRNSTIEKIAQVLVQWQRTFFLNSDGKLTPLTMKTVADELQLHESTVARAVANKYMDSPRGILPLRAFFTNAMPTNEGKEVSSQTVRDLLKELIDKEEKKNPLSDETLSAMMKAKGFQCARRTVAKYRIALKIGTSHQRRKYNDD